jgi:hypothetical protein
MSTNVQLYDYSTPEERKAILDGIRELTIKGAPNYNMVIVSLVFFEKEETTKIHVQDDSKVPANLQEQQLLEVIKKVLCTYTPQVTQVTRVSLPTSNTCCSYRCTWTLESPCISIIFIQIRIMCQNVSEFSRTSNKFKNWGFCFARFSS